MDAIGDLIVAKANYWMTIALMMVGLWALIAKRNLVKKIIGMNIFQTAVILFFISMAAKQEATLPIVEHAADPAHQMVPVVAVINPLPHVLMLTAIVVAVATLGVALALAIRIHKQHGSLDEVEILNQLKRPLPEENHGHPG